jgi:hypothetical protein
MAFGYLAHPSEQQHIRQEVAAFRADAEMGIELLRVEFVPVIVKPPREFLLYLGARHRSALQLRR